jgi:hypothetical protein
MDSNAPTARSIPKKTNTLGTAIRGNAPATEYFFFLDSSGSGLINSETTHITPYRNRIPRNGGK